MRPFLWILAAFALLIVILIPVTYLVVGAQLPPLESEFDLERLLRQSIESERRSMQMGLYEKSKDPITWERPDFAALPKNLVGFYITERGCPTYFQTPREDGWPWAKRVLLGVLNVEPEDTDGWCERVFAANIAKRIGTKGALQEAVAIYKMHRYLKKDGLVAYDLHTVKAAPGVVGILAASHEMFGKPVDDLTLHELAELTLAMPPHGYWGQMISCQNATLIRQNRDVLIDNLRRVGLVPEDSARAAKREQVACLREK